MKKLSISLIMIIIWCNASSQVFSGLNVTNKGAGLSLGAENNNVALTIAMSHPLLKTENYTTYSMQVGYIYPIGTESGFILGLHGGMAYCTKKVIKAEIQQLNEFKGIYTFEAGKNMGTGRLSLICNYVGAAVSYGMSMKVFFN